MSRQETAAANANVASVNKIIKQYEQKLADQKALFDKEISNAIVKARTTALNYFREKTEDAIGIFK